MTFFFFDVELILSVKKGKKVIFEEIRLKKFAKKAEYPLKLICIYIVDIFLGYCVCESAQGLDATFQDICRSWRYRGSM